MADITYINNVNILHLFFNLGGFGKSLSFSLLVRRRDLTDSIISKAFFSSVRVIVISAPSPISHKRFESGSGDEGAIKDLLPCCLLGRVLVRV